MPSPLTNSFASAAAGNTPENRRDTSGGAEWSRSRANGATQTFRRPSLATSLSHNRDSAPSVTTPSGTAGAYIPPHMNSNYSGPYRNGMTGDMRYSREQLINIYKDQRDTGNLNQNLSELFSGGWHPTEARNGTAASWGKRDDGKDQPIGPDVCWDHNGKVQPLGMSEMTDEEREIFTSSVNSPLKAPTTTKDATPGSAGNRKTSISQNGPYNASTPSGRPGVRRRETGDSSIGANPLSPTGNTRFFRDDPNTSTPPAALLRRKTDLKEPASETKSATKTKEESAEISSPFDSLKRRPTGGPLSASIAGPESPWSAGPQSAGFTGMGAFGNFSLAPGATSVEPPQSDKRPGFGSMRGESRFKGLLSKASSEDIASSAMQDKSSLANLGKLPEDDAGEANQRWEAQSRQNRSATNPYEDEMQQGGNRYDTDPRSDMQSGERGFSAFGDSMRNLVAEHQQSQQTPQGHHYSQDPMSPTVTNPYQSPQGPHGHGEDDNPEMSEVRRLNFGGLGALREDSSADAFGSLRGKPSAFVDDRSQTSSTGPGRGFSAFGGLPNIGGPSPWSADPIGSTGTPTKDRSGFPSAFGASMFGELQSPNLAGSGLFGPSNTGSFGRASKMGSLFPQAMQEQMRGDVSRPESAGDGFGGFKQGGEQRMPGFGEFGGMPQSQEEANWQSSAFNQPPSAPGSSAMANVAPAEGQQNQAVSQSSGSSNSNQLPASQQRTMVMPDRMRWIYRDPQGNVQGPWSGLEMHDWFKAGFFTAELQVKKLEDGEYEPLAQLVRRIGNSREPFLVPQIGVPHGPAAPSSGNPWAGGASVSGGVPQGGGTAPPFASSFPSFGTTLTAEQQNALERRKQEEQYLMARQKEHLAQQQIMMKQMGLQGGSHTLQHGLQHHSSAHSLHSQPSFGSITSPSGYQASPTQAPIQPPPSSNFQDQPRQPQQAPFGGPPRRNEVDDLPPFFERMSTNQTGQYPFGSGPFGGRAPEGASQQAIGNMLQDRAKLQAEQQQQMRLSGDSLPDPMPDRLQEFHDLRDQIDAYQGGAPGQGPSAVPIGGHARPRQEGLPKQPDTAAPSQAKEFQESPEPEMLSLSQQAQDIGAEQQQPPASVWASKIEQPLAPPPQSASPLPAPAAQRRHIVADTLVAESRSQTQTPVETPSASIAPWAEKAVEAPKGPSLKEIQEAEARKAAKQEEQAAAARRALAELERQQAAAMVQAPAPGLPSSANWANTTAVASPVTGGSVWAKATTSKPAAPATPTTAAKKTLAQIQKEEELRKKREVAAALAASAQSGNNGLTAGGGKRYAELAGKIAPATPPLSTAPPGAWTTVGSGGKVKAPATVVAAPGAVQRAPSGPAPLVNKARPVAPRAPGSTVAAQPVAHSKATDELTKWAKGQLARGLSSGINVDEFVQSLLILPNESEIISDSVYANSQTLDGRRFAEEYIRKRRLADKGIIETSSSTPPPDATKSVAGGNNGWSEVAKKGPEKQKEEGAGGGNAAFKVVAGKKKGRR